MLWLFAALLIGLAIIFGIHRSLSTSVDTRNPFVGVSKRILLVTSHPDDECMFFSPTILNLQRMGHEVLLLCLSIGGHYGLGKRRIKELYASGSILGLLADNITILDDKRLLDGPDEHWSKEVIEELVSKHLQKKSVDAVITFDEGGVSGHPNHIAVNQGIRYMQTSGKLKGCNWSNWGRWSYGGCSKTCGSGSSSGSRTRSTLASCTQNMQTQTRPCNQGTCRGCTWSEWEAWTSCDIHKRDVPYPEGRKRTRERIYSFNGGPPECHGSSIDEFCFDNYRDPE